MKKYRLRILYMGGTISYYNHNVLAKEFDISDGAYVFYDEVNELVFASPVKVTVIENIKKLD